VWSCQAPTPTQEVLVVHPNAPLSELGRLRLARAIVDQGWPVARAAERFQVSRPTAQRWATRYRDQGPAGMADRSSRPHHSPRRTPAPVVRRIVHLRWKQRLGPAQIAPRSAWLPPRCMLSWSAAASAAWPIWTGSPASLSAATSTTSPAPWSTSTSRSWATSPLGWPPVPGPRRRETQPPGRPLQRTAPPPSQPPDWSGGYPRRRR
jgi:transposase-like protein